MSVQRSIENDLQQAFSPRFLSVVNESSMHNVPPGSESHFKVILVAEEFSELRKVARHQRVYSVLATQLAEGVHALALHTYSPVEWQTRGDTELSSPACLGGSKHDAP